MQREPFQAWLLSNYTGKAIYGQCFLKLTTAQNQRTKMKEDDIEVYSTTGIIFKAPIITTFNTIAKTTIYQKQQP